MTIQRRTVHLLATGVFSLVLAYALPGPGTPPAGREATVLAAAGSVWEDGDLGFGPEDVARIERDWAGGQRGVALVESGAERGEMDRVYALPFLYPVVAAPAYGALGPKGLRMLGVGLYLLVFWTAWRLLGHPRGCRRLPRSGLTLAAFFFASAGLAHALRLSPVVFGMACVFFALALWCRVRERPLWGSREIVPLATAGVLAAAAFASEPALGLFALPPAIDLAWSRRWKGSAAFLVAAVAAGWLLLAVQQDLTGALRWQWGWGLPEAARVYDGALPTQPGVSAGTKGGGPADFGELASEEAAGGWFENGAGNLWLLLVGRHVGLVPYFPFAIFVVGLYLADLRRPGGRTRHLVAAALLAYLVLVAGSLPVVATDPAGPGLAVVVAVYPLFLFLPWRLRAGKAVLLPFAAAGLWAVPAVISAIGPVAPAAVFELHARGPSFRWLPIEAPLLVSGGLPGYADYRRPEALGFGHWLVPREAFFEQERRQDGIWVRGAVRAEVHVISEGEAPEIRLRVGSISADNVLTLEGAGGRTVVRFDSAAKRAGTPVTVRPEVLTRLDTDADGEPETLGRFILTTTHGAIPARIDPASDDTRFLGVFLKLD